VIRQQGYSITVSERYAGVFSIAAPVFNDSGYPAALLAIVGPVSRLGKWMPGQFIPLLTREAQGLSYDLGFSTSHLGLPAFQMST
jgi:DNA-binding IclR family transcriptional regulator